MTDIETQQLCPTIIYWLTCRHEQTINCLFVRTTDPFLQFFRFPTSWTTWNLRTKNRQKNLTIYNFSNLFSTKKTASIFLQSCSKEFFRFIGIWDYIVNMHERNGQSIISHHMTTFQNEGWLLSVERMTWKQKKGRFGIQKRVTTHKRHHSCRHSTSVFKWRSLLLSLPPCSKRVWLLGLCSI